MWKLWEAKLALPFDEKIATFEEDDGAYNQADAEGFIKLNALRLRTLASKRSKDS